MLIKEINGNLLDSHAEIIIHQVNCQGVMGSGVAKAIKEKWPVVFFKYKKFVDDNNDVLGTVLPVMVTEQQRVLNLFSQFNYGYDGQRYTSYDAVDTCLKKVAKYCSDNGVKTLAMPYNMACGRGGANWNIIMEMVKQHFSDLDITIEIWKI